ncbi:MAG: sigma 54-interacting transcriptional regulator, partial [Clostridiales bacterium]|nr:sigma 54-interacting transcriptional regulator [Clostridiales bacterium]
MNNSESHNKTKTLTQGSGASLSTPEHCNEMEIAMHELSLVNEQLNTIIQSMKSGVLMIDHTGRITQYNKSAVKMLKLKTKNLKNSFLCDLLTDEDCTYLLNNGEDLHKKEISLTNIDGKTVNLLISSHVAKDDEHGISSTVFIFEEIENIHKMVSRMSGFTAKYTFDSIIGQSKAMSDVIKVGKICAESDSNVLILGESGTGKDLLAQAIHNSSSRSKGPFIAINCGSIPKGLIESELFGYEAGSFTGARKDGYPGKFELADGGTIFLDEIGDMPIDLQSSLLRVIQTKEIVRIGGTRPKAVNVRIIAATNASLAKQIREKHFRMDLYYRLNVLTIVIPPLRKRREDIMILVNHFIEKYNRIIGKNIEGITPKAESILNSYDWPGNVRELENIIERAINLAEGDMITEKDLSMDLTSKNDILSNNSIISSKPKLMPIQSLECELI